MVCVDVDPKAADAAEGSISGEAARMGFSLEVLRADAFRVWKKITAADVVVTNSPFIRWGAFRGRGEGDRPRIREGVVNMIA